MPLESKTFASQINITSNYVALSLLTLIMLFLTLHFLPFVCFQLFYFIT